MEMFSARSPSIQERLGPVPVKNQVCKYWLRGMCNRNRCKFLHSDPQAQQKTVQPFRKPVEQQSGKYTWKNPNNITTRSSPVQPKALSAITVETEQISTERIAVQPKVLADVTAETDKISAQNPQPKQCKHWVTGNCVHGDNCQDIHSWFSGSGFRLLAKLEGHNKAVTGIVLPSGSDKLYSGGEDGSVRVWDCNTGLCAGVVDINAQVGCLITNSPWLFLGLPNVVKGWNSQNQAEFSLNAPAGLVCSIDVDDDNLYAGMEDGTIFVWKWNTENVILDPAVVLKEHSGVVHSIIIGGYGKLYSGSKDGTIKQWDRQNMQCVQTLYGHTAEVTSLICWNKFLLSASLDRTIKVWGVGENGKVEVVYERKEDDGVLVLCGIYDSEEKPILMCSYLDNTVRLYDIPSFAERGRIFSKQLVRTIQTGADRLFFTGDASGEVSAWSLQ